MSKVIIISTWTSLSFETRLKYFPTLKLETVKDNEKNTVIFIVRPFVENELKNTGEKILSWKILLVDSEKNKE